MREEDESNIRNGQTDMDLYEDGEPCKHPGCLQHVTHPCEGCGRIAGIVQTKTNSNMSL